MSDVKKEKDYTPVEKSWEEFRGNGLLWFINSILHVFGWAIVLQMNEKTKEIIRAYPARVRYRGFSEDATTRGYINITKWVKEHAEELLDEAEDK